MGNYAMTVPLPMALDNQQEGFRKLVELGYKEAPSQKPMAQMLYAACSRSYSRSRAKTWDSHRPCVHQRTGTNGPISCDDSSYCASRFVLGIGSSSNVRLNLERNTFPRAL